MKTYSLPEAIAVLPQVRTLLAQVVEIANTLPDLEDEAHIADYEAARSGASGDLVARRAQNRNALRATQIELVDVLEALAAMGIQVKDARTGLVDFLSYRDGELVELCWKLGEAGIGHWHPIGEGFSGRRPL
jgi:hypothetical protein